MPAKTKSKKASAKKAPRKKKASAAKNHSGMYAPRESRKSCPMCGSAKSKVKKSWVPEGTTQRRRLRECECGATFNTVEWNAESPT